MEVSERVRNYGKRNIIEVVEILNRIYGLHIWVEFVTGKGYSSYDQYRRVIEISADALDSYIRYGVAEYPSVARKIGCKPRSLKGSAATRWVAMHEYAHVLQYAWQKENDPRADPNGEGGIRGSIHNATFIRFYEEVVSHIAIRKKIY